MSMGILVRRLGWACLAFGVVAATGCAARRVEGWRVSPGAAAAGSAAEFEAARARAMEHWARRDSLEALRSAITGLEEALRLNPASIEVASLMSRGYYFLAERTENEEERLATYQTGTQRGEQAMAISPGFRAALSRGASTDEALRSLGREYVPAMYWTAVNLGRWARARGFMTILANRRRIQHLVQRVTELDSTYFYAAPDRYWGAYYAIAPSIAGGDKDRSRTHFERALQIEPNYIGTRVTYAETYAVGVQNRALFEEQLRLALATPVDVIPEIIPEQRLEQEKARRFLARTDELFAR